LAFSALEARGDSPLRCRPDHVGSGSLPVSVFSFIAIAWIMPALLLSCLLASGLLRKRTYSDNEGHEDEADSAQIAVWREDPNAPIRADP
jgi:hypothetical protein